MQSFKWPFITLAFASQLNSETWMSIYVIATANWMIQKQFDPTSKIVVQLEEHTLRPHTLR